MQSAKKTKSLPQQFDRGRIKSTNPVANFLHALPDWVGPQLPSWGAGCGIYFAKS